MPLSFLCIFMMAFSSTESRQPSPYCKAKLSMLTKTPYLCTHQFCRMVKSICRMNWHSASSKSIGIFVVRRWICSITEIILHWFQKHCISQAFLCLIVIFHKALHLGDNICSRFNAVSTNISYKTYKSTKSSIVLQNHLANVQKNQISLSKGIMRLITSISKFSCCLYSVKIVCIRSDSVLKRHLFFAKWFHFCRCNTFNKRLLFEIYVVVAYFISFKPERKSSCNLPW